MPGRQRRQDGRVDMDSIGLASTFAGAETQQAWSAATALRDSVLASATTSNESAVCRVQLQWWSDELKRLAVGEPRHPVSKQFVERCPMTEYTLGLVQEWLILAER